MRRRSVVFYGGLVAWFLWSVGFIVGSFVWVVVFGAIVAIAATLAVFDVV